MNQLDHVKKDPPTERTLIKKPAQADAWLPADQQIWDANVDTRKLIKAVPAEGSQRTKAEVHACKASKRGYQGARDQIGRANRDLGETAAFVATMLTTVTAVEAVITIAIEKIKLSIGVMQGAFVVYIAVCILVLVWGAIRGGNALRRRAQAEMDIDLAKKAIFEFCPGGEWPADA